MSDKGDDNEKEKTDDYRTKEPDFEGQVEALGKSEDKVKEENDNE
ncbi:hypothetical protein [Halanaeroarchaeum sp. HSR-CO]|nr:hypothetical protein [Halanaeroarchaeum sp. HSR-CO]